MNKYPQSALAFFSICLVFLLGLSTVNKEIHNGLFHPEFTSTSHSHQGCSNQDSGPCPGGTPNQDSRGCDSSCPVNIFSSGILALETLEELPTTSSLQSGYDFIFYTSHISGNEKKSHLVRGPPLYS